MRPFSFYISALGKKIFPGFRSSILGFIQKRKIRKNPNWKGVFAYPPGHFYSPLLDIKSLCRENGQVRDDGKELWKFIDLQIDGQRQILQKIFCAHRIPKWPAKKDSQYRYFSGGGSFPLADAVLLSLIIQEFKPERILEIGGGFSTAVMLDTLENVSEKTTIQVIEPYPDRLKDLLRPEDWARLQLLERPLQDFDPAGFKQLQTNDILFIDSSHVAKIGSDVTLLFLKILPSLKKDVLIHLHDISYPESYPYDWVKSGWAWNESLFLRAFLIGNQAFRILAFNSYAGKEFRDILDRHYPALAVDPGGHGGSLWLQKIT